MFEREREREREREKHEKQSKHEEARGILAAAQKKNDTWSLMQCG